MVDSEIRYEKFCKELMQKATLLGLSASCFVTVEYDKEYPIIRLETMKSHECKVIITAGFHGDETAGPLTILDRLKEIALYADKNGVDLIFYPCINPSGFENRTRYNAKDEKPNNDFLRYRKGGLWLKDIKNSDEYDEWCWSSDLGEKLPQETEILHHELKKLPLNSIKGFIDLHQDSFGDYEGAYAYIYDDKEIYLPIALEVEQIVSTVKNTDIDAGFTSAVHSDEYGFLYRHDGSIHDLFYRLGIPYSVTVETTTNLNISKAIEINMVWIKGIILMASKKSAKSHY